MTFMIARPFGLLLIAVSLVFVAKPASGCAILFFKDAATGKVYAANNEDYWYNTDAYIRIMPESKDDFARLWYGWDNFAQGGVNEYGLFFDGAVTPKEELEAGHKRPKGNLGDELLAKCKTAQEAVDFLESKKVALTEGIFCLATKVEMLLW